MKVKKTKNQARGLVSLMVLILAGSVAWAQNPKPSGYVGSDTCMPCHEAEYENFTKYARKSHSFQSVQIMQKGLTAEELRGCYTCHTTGYGEVSEFEDFDEIPIYLWGIQCETCHGPGKGHPGFGVEFRRVTLGVCRSCHTKDQSPAFHYRSYLLRIGCTIRK